MDAAHNAPKPAAMSSLNGWLQTKKRGRDDAKIKCDAAKAHKARQRAKMVPKKKKREALRSNDDDHDNLNDFIVGDEEEVSDVKEESSSEEEDTFFKTYKKRTSKPPANHSLTAAQKRKALPMIEPTIELLSSDDDVPAKAAKKPSSVLDDSDDDDSLPSASKLGQKSRHFATDSLQSLETKKPAASKSRLPAKTTLGSDTENDFTPLPKAAAKTNHRWDTEDDDTPLVVKSKPQQEHKNKRTINDDDEDEDVALALALSASMTEAHKVSRDNSDNDQPINDLVDSSEDEQEDQVAYHVEEDQDAKAAGSLLDTANDLSAKVVAAMASWHKKQESDDGDRAVPMGMIVDGALALSSISGSSGNHRWISHETMKNVCPEVKLADYQLVGINWLALLHEMTFDIEGSDSRMNVNGILADEMGLGKTVQTIAFLSWLKYSRSNNSSEDPIVLDDDDDKPDLSAELLPHLVVAPASVLANWKREFEKFAPHLNVIKYHGSMSERHDLQDELRLHLPGRQASRRKLGLNPIDVILVPITYFQCEKSDDRSFLRKFKFDFLIVDEGHVLKNSKGLRYKNLDRFSTRHRLLLTGTPVQNSPKELMALLCFLMPLFARQAPNPYEESDNDGGESMLRYFVSLEGQKGSSDEAAYRKLKQLFAPFVLRRKKEDVLSQILPPKERKVEFVELDVSARSLYDSIISDHVRSKKNGDSSSREHVFTQLRKAAHHPLLIRSRYKSASEKDHLARVFYQYGAFRGEGCTRAKVAEELEGFNDFDIHLTALELVEENPHRRPDLERYILDEQDLFSSAKFVCLRSLLPELTQNGHRVLIFSVWTRCLDLLSCLMEQMGLKYLRMEGSTAVSERQALIDEFNNDSSIPVFLLSTNACGLGINLTAADTCIMHDLSFNPFNDLQAEDRCHRISQQKPVTVYKLVSKDTVDEDIYAMQERKAKMNAAIMESGSAWKKKAAQEKEMVLQTAVDRFMRSPGGAKENSPALDSASI